MYSASDMEPIRHGDIYCAPFCGRGCTVDEFERATKRARDTASMLGKDWTPHVWENLGWHASVLSPTQHLKVAIHETADGIRYSAFLGEPNFHLIGRWTSRRSNKTARGAIADVMLQARADLKEIQVIVRAVESLPRSTRIAPVARARAARPKPSKRSTAK